jgi:hypothetical protein
MGKSCTIITIISHSEPSGRMVAARKLRTNKRGRLGAVKREYRMSIRGRYSKNNNLTRVCLDLLPFLYL